MNTIAVNNLDFPTVKIQLDTWATYMAGATLARNLRNELLIDFYIENREIGLMGHDLESFAPTQPTHLDILDSLQTANFDTYINYLEGRIESMLITTPTLKKDLTTNSNTFQTKFSNFLKVLDLVGKDPTLEEQDLLSKLEKKLENAELAMADFERLTGAQGIPLVIEEKYLSMHNMETSFAQSITVTNHFYFDHDLEFTYPVPPHNKPFD